MYRENRYHEYLCLVSSIIIFIIFYGFQNYNKWTNSGLESKNVISLVVNPIDKAIILAGVTDQGIYRSDDSGKTWLCVWSGSSIYCFAIDRRNPQVIYAGLDGGILISKNGGVHFEKFINMDTQIIVNCIILDETQSKAFIFGTNQGVYKSFDNGKTILEAGLQDHEILSMAINNSVVKPIIYASTRTSGIYRTTNYGLSWTPINKGLEDLQIYSIISDIKQPSKLYAATFSAGIYKSENGGNDWHNVSLDLESLEAYIIVQAVDNSLNRTIVYIANFSGEVYKTVDGGNSWAKVGEALDEVIGLSLGIANIVPSILYFGTNKGVYKIEEKGE